MKSLKTLTLKDILLKGIHYNYYDKLNKNKLNIYYNKLLIAPIISNLYNFYKIIYYLKLRDIKFIFIYTLKNKLVKNLIKKISKLNSIFYFMSTWRSGVFTNKTILHKKILLAKTILSFKKLLTKKYLKTKNKKLLKLLFKIKANKKLAIQKYLINTNVLLLNFFIFLSPQKDIKIIREAYVTNKIIIIFEKIKSFFSDFSIIYSDTINKPKLLFYFSLFNSL